MTTSNTLEAQLTARLSTVLGSPCAISDLRPLTGGASRQTWSFTADTADGGDPAASRALILRLDPIGSEGAARMQIETDALIAAGRAGVAVPEVVDHSGAAAPDTLGGAYMIMERVDGEALPQKLLRHADYDNIRPHLAHEMGRALARIHSADADSVPNLPEEDQLETLYGEYVAYGAPLPALEMAFRHLREGRRPPQRTTLVHGDFRLGNLLVTREAITGVLDWELTHRGDPVEDLGWLCTRAWRFGSPHRVGGVGELDDLLAGYAQESGIDIDPEAVAWWQLFGSLRWAVICRQQAERAYSEAGHDKLELLAIGRRVAECEYDLLLDLGWNPSYRHSEPIDASTDLYGAPTAAELLGAVGEFIAELAADASVRNRYRSKVAAHVLGIVTRESTVGSAARQDFAELVSQTGYDSEAALALAIRAGTADPDAPPVAAAIKAAVGLRLSVSNPKHGVPPVP